MRKLAFGALFVGFLAACGGGSGTKKVIITDADNGGDGGLCNVLTQTGCDTGQKCTWIVDTTSLGHIGCSPDGTMAVGAACTRGAPGATGIDDCKKGGYCFGPDAGGAGTCKLICDQAGGSPMCGANSTCVPYDGLFGASGQPDAAGVCEPSCDPLADNNFLGSGSTKTGSNCSAARGCYGFPPLFQSSTPTAFSCASEVNPTRVHRSACTDTKATGDSYPCTMSGSIFPNSCAQGYQPLFRDAEGSQQEDCMAMCKPANCYAGNCGTGGTANLPGDPASGHQCKTANIRVDATNGTTFLQETAAGNDGDQCLYWWFFEFDASNNFVHSQYSDTVGLCVNHSRFQYDSNNDGSAGTAGDLAWPACNTFTTGSGGTGSAVAGACTGGAGSQCCSAANGCVGAADFACTDTTVGGVSFSGKRPAHMQNLGLRLPYNRTALRGRE